MTRGADEDEVDLVTWRYRSLIARSVFTRLSVVWASVSIVVLIVTLVVTEVALVDLLPWAVVWGFLAAAGLFGFGLFTNPLNFRYLRRFIDRPYDYAPGPVEGEVHDNFRALISQYDLTPGVTATDVSADPQPAFDLCHSANGFVIGAVGRTTGTVTLMSRLSDGRILVTSDLVLPPHSALLANPVTGDELRAVVRGHRRRLDLLTTKSIRPVPDSPRIFAEVMAAEHSAYETLGPVYGAFSRIDGRTRPHRLMVTPTLSG